MQNLSSQSATDLDPDHYFACSHQLSKSNCLVCGEEFTNCPTCLPDQLVCLKHRKPINKGYIHYACHHKLSKIICWHCGEAFLSCPYCNPSLFVCSKCTRFITDQPTPRNKYFHTIQKDREKEISVLSKSTSHVVKNIKPKYANYAINYRRMRKKIRRKYYLKNRERLNIKRKEHYHSDPDYHNKLRAYDRHYKEIHKAELAQAKADYYQAHRKEINEYHRIYQANQRLLKRQRSSILVQDPVQPGEQGL